jgi:hypothetical protein
METATERFRSGMCIHTSRAVDALKEGKPGDLISRDKMASIIGRDVSDGTNGYGNVNSAIRHVEGQLGVVWRWDRSAKAWRCLNDVEKSEVSIDGVKRSRRVLGRSMRVAATVNEEALTEDQRKEHRLNCVVAGTMQLFGKPEFRKKLAAANGSLVEPNPQKVIELMKRA